jgi:hypothetical protein
VEQSIFEISPEDTNQKEKKKKNPFCFWVQVTFSP